MNCATSYARVQGGYRPLMCLIDLPLKYRYLTASGQKDLADLVEIIVTPMNYDSLATEGASCGMFVHLGGSKGNFEILELVFKLMHRQGIGNADNTHCINVPAKNSNKKNAMDMCWRNKVQQTKKTARD